MGGFDIRRASEKLNNMPTAKGNAQAIAHFNPYQNRDQAGEMIKGLGHALDSAAKFGTDFIDARINMKDKSDLAAMRADYDKAMGLKMNAILEQNNNDLSKVRPEDWQRASKEVTDNLVRQYKPMARTMHQFNEHRGQAEASGIVRIDGAVKRAETNILEARLQSQENAALERHTAEQSTTSLENYWRAVYDRNEGRYGAEVANEMANGAVRKQVLNDKLTRIKATDDEDQLDQLAEALDSGALADAMDKKAAEAKEKGEEPDFSNVTEMGKVLYSHNALRHDKKELEILQDAIKQQRKIIRAEEDEQNRIVRHQQQNDYVNTALRINYTDPNTGEKVSESTLLKEREAIIRDQTTWAANPDIKMRILDAYDTRLAIIKKERALDKKSEEDRSTALAEAAKNYRNADAADIIWQAMCLKYHQGETTPEVVEKQAQLYARIQAGLNAGWLDPHKADEAFRILGEKLTRDEQTALRKLDEAFNITWSAEDKTGRLTNTKHAPNAVMKWKIPGFINRYKMEFSAEDYSTIRAELLKQLRQLPPGADKNEMARQLVKDIRTGFVQNKLKNNTEAVIQQIQMNIVNSGGVERAKDNIRKTDAKRENETKRNYYNATMQGFDPSGTIETELDENGVPIDEPGN